jgi:hypothetical protein
MKHPFRIALAAVSLLSLTAAAGGVRIGTGGADVPDKPLEGQQRAPCGGAKEISGGCWLEVVQASGACWFYRNKADGKCYSPIMEKSAQTK